MIPNRSQRRRGAKRHLMRCAHRAVSHAIRDGRLTSARRHRCAKCGCWAESWHHYRGYQPEHWLTVEPLCRPCHDLADGRRGGAV